MRWSGVPDFVYSAMKTTVQGDGTVPRRRAGGSGTDRNAGMQLTEAFIADVNERIRNDGLPLPMLPEVIVQVRRYVDDPDTPLKDLIKALRAEAVLAGRLIQMANSPFFRGVKPVEDLQSAVSRLGAVCIRNLVISLAVAQLFQGRTLAPVRDSLRDAWEDSTRVGAASYVLARRFTTWHPDEALLAGLLHNVGVLPLLAALAEQPTPLPADPAGRAELLGDWHLHTGPVLLEHWGFPDKLIRAVAEHQDLERLPDEGPDYADVVLVANLHARLGTGHPLARVRWDGIPAFQRLGLTPESSIIALREARAEVEGVRRILEV